MKQRKKLKERNYKERQKNLTSQISKLTSKSKGITLIALVITIIVLIILAGISISLVLGQNGLFNKAKGAATETAKARFVEDAGFAYSEAYIEKTEKSDSNNITIGDIVSKLKSSYGYTDEQIKTLSSGVSGITLSETEVTLEPGETKEVTVTLENGTYYVLIEGLYYPITLSNTGITLGEGVASLPEGEGTTNKITATATTGGDLVNVTVVEGTTIKITAKEGQKQVGEAIVTITYGEGISKEIKVKIKVEVKQGDVLPLGDVKVGSSQITLAKGWKYFYNDVTNNKVWLIYDGILEGAAQQVGGTIKLSGNSVYSSSSRDDLINYLNGTGSYVGKWDHIKAGIKNALKGITMTEEEENQIEVKGSPDIELFQKAYDQMYPIEKFQVQKNNIGWQYRFGGAGSFANLVSVTNYSSKKLFFIGNGYWLASPSASASNSMCIVATNSYFNFGLHNDYTITGARPVVSIPASAFNQLIS